MKKKNNHHYQHKNHHHAPQKKIKVKMNDNVGENDSDNSSNGENDFTIPLTMIYFDQCDPKKCTGKKLQKLGLLNETKFYSTYPGILLTPTGKKIVSIEDQDIIRKNGICVLDCSWAKFNELNLNLHKIETRSLPYMVAVNPVNYGKAYKLTCAEAIAATLILGGFEREARFVMNHFKWGPAFFEVNGELFDMYNGAKNGEELKALEEKYIKEELENKEKRKMSDGLGELEEEIEQEEEEDYGIDMNVFQNIDADKLAGELTGEHDKKEK